MEEGATGATSRPLVMPAAVLLPLAWAAGSLIVTFTVLNLVLLVLNFSTGSPTGTTDGSLEFVAALGYLAMGTIGIVVVGRRLENGGGWVFLVTSCSLALAAFCSEYATYGVLTDPGGLPGVRWVAWLGVWVWWGGAAFGLAFTMLLYPDGSLPGARWRTMAPVALVNVVLLCLLHALTPGRLDGEYSIVFNPVGADGARTVLQPLRDLGWLLLLVNGVLGTAAVVSRHRATAGRERRPLSWLAAAGAATVVATVMWGISGGGDGGPSTAVQFGVGIGLLAVPLAMVSARAQTAALRRSVERLVLAREGERLRIRRDLHDGLGPTLAGVALQLDLARSLIATDQAAVESILERLTGQVQSAVGDIRRLVDDLRPPVLDQLGLVPAIEQTTSHLSRGSEGARFSVSVASSGDLARLSPAVEVSAFRIVLEAVTNAFRHSRASTCQVNLALGRALEITVEDDGVGLPHDHHVGVGLVSMQERTAQLAGSCRFEPRPGGGTVVRVELPVTAI